MSDNASVSDAEHLARSVLASNDPTWFALWKLWALDLADAVVALVAERDEARREVEGLKRWQKAYAKGRSGLVQQADQDFARAEAAEARAATLQTALRPFAAKVCVHVYGAGTGFADFSEASRDCDHCRARAALAEGGTHE